MTTAKKHAYITDEILDLFHRRGDSLYGGEAVTQRQHALQVATFAERDGAGPELITAALLHDIGHLLHELPHDAPDHGIDDRHETLAAAWLAQRFQPSVVAPVAMHVAAKRYLCAVESSYLGKLSQPSIQSLALQGWPMTADEVKQFESRPFFRDAVRLRKWDDTAKVVGMQTPVLDYFAHYIDRALETNFKWSNKMLQSLALESLAWRMPGRQLSADTALRFLNATLGPTERRFGTSA